MVVEDHPYRFNPHNASSREAGDGRSAPHGGALAHLAGPAAALRQVLAAHAVRFCPEIIEIGGAGLPITAFLNHGPEAVTVIDPKIPPFEAEKLAGAPCRVRHLAAKLQESDLAVPAGPFGLVLLGLSLKPFGRKEAVAPILLALAAAARTLVIDYAVDLDRARGQIGALIAARADRPSIDLTLEIEDPVIRAAGFARRRFVVFGPA